MNEANAKQQIADAIKGHSNILVTVNDSPSVDELSAALGLTILLNKLDKRATCIVSGEVPPAIEFLDPEKTFEGTVDSLRDFIIALDKEKADHLRYKVDGDVVKIFITPYRTTLSDKDLTFSQGDYNVEVVLALGVKDQDRLDKALSAHGRILHDAVVATIATGTEPSRLGSIDWHEEGVSSLSEMIVALSGVLGDNRQVLDEQISTALLTGIVSATERFSNDHTSSGVMTIAAQLMAAGANQQLIAAKLNESHEVEAPEPIKEEKSTSDSEPLGAVDGMIFSHDEDKTEENKEDTSAQDENQDAVVLLHDDESTVEESTPEEPKLDAELEAFELPPTPPLASEEEQPATESPIDAAIAQSQTDDTSAEDETQAFLPTLPDVQAIAAEPADGAQDEPTPNVVSSVKSLPVIEPIHAPEEVLIDQTPERNNDEVANADLEKQLQQAEAESDLGTQASNVLGLPSTDSQMPGFEALDVPGLAPAPSLVVDTPAPAPEVAPLAPPAFDTAPAPTQAPTSSLADPFSVALPGLGAPAAPAPEAFAPPAPAAAPAFGTPPAQEPFGAAPAVPSMPTLPPMPDFSSLPPLPPPPAPPVFDQQPGLAPPMAPAGIPTLSSDPFGGFTPTPPPATMAPPVEQTPPPPGQFRIPGQ